ncbi:MAG: transporter [Proteobacteria bacterium]|nr:transporter [Pseudomonadota bacterium]
MQQAAWRTLAISERLDLLPRTAAEPGPMSPFTLFSRLLALTPALPLCAHAQDSPRPFSPDRPSFTGSPYTLDPGQFQFEMTIGSLTRDKTNDAGAPTEIEVIGTGAPTLRWGVTDDFELQLAFGGLLIADARTPSGHQRLASAGDASVSSKINFWGNDSGDSAFGMIPYMSLPVSPPASGDRRVTGGATFPLALALPSGISFGLQAGIEMNPNETGSGYGAVVNNAAIAGVNLTPKIGGYIEIFNVKDTRAGNAWENSAGLGLSYRYTDDVQFDTGVNVGLSEVADDLELFIGFSVRR